VAQELYQAREKVAAVGVDVQQLVSFVPCCHTVSCKAAAWHHKALPFSCVHT